MFLSSTLFLNEMSPYLSPTPRSQFLGDVSVSLGKPTKVVKSTPQNVFLTPEPSGEWGLPESHYPIKSSYTNVPRCWEDLSTVKVLVIFMDLFPIFQVVVLRSFKLLY